MKDLMTIIGIDGAAGLTIYATDPNFLKWVLGLGIASLLGFVVLTKQGRVSIYGSNLVIAFLTVMHYY